MEEHFVGKVSQKAIIEKEGKVLLVRDINDLDIWELPGGRLNTGEILSEGLSRELLEELGAAIDIHEIVYSEQSLHTQKGEWALFLIYRAGLRDETADFVLQKEEVAEVKWIDEAQLYEQKIYETYLRGLEAYFNIQR